MQKIVGVRFKDGGKTYFFAPNGVNAKTGDKVIVETVAGQQLGVVAFDERDIKPCENQSVDLKPIVRLASERDVARHEDLLKKAKETIKLTKEKVAKLKLAMKISDAFYTFDAGKLIIEFTADDRVDFRELLKELASTFKVRIELRQIGQRDEVKNKGGLGPCGQMCCCSKFLGDFEHVTVKMAKTQGLSLSPSKINGLCGRLMCCLGYENENYEKILEKMPKLNSEVVSPKGKGTCVYRDCLRELVSVKFMGNDGSIMVEEFPLSEINFNNKGE
ncbi:MAG: stage 0 sporulation family protein [Clostridia bacterium]|nr:stage 0 sporulation family protein [Clostridia bacterium]